MSSESAEEEILAKVAHELRQPVAAIVAAVQLLKVANDSRAIDRGRGVLERQSAQLARLVDDLLQAVQAGRGRIDLHLARIDARAAVEEAVETIRLTSRRLGRLEVTVPGMPIWIDADAGRLHQILLNLLSNALKHTPEEQPIWIEAERQGLQARLTVGDGGDGIPPDALIRIFDLFAKVPGSRSSGFGVGLAVVKQLTELQGGTVEAFSDGPGRGSRFVVTLPARPADVPALPPFGTSRFERAC